MTADRLSKRCSGLSNRATPSITRQRKNRGSEDPRYAFVETFRWNVSSPMAARAAENSISLDEKRRGLVYDGGAKQQEE